VIVIDEGGEYKGERYIYCDGHGWPPPYFEGYTLDELKAYIAEHENHPRNW